MSETPIGDQTASDLSAASQTPDDAVTPDQQAHDDAVPTDVPDSPDVPDTDDGTTIPVDSPDDADTPDEAQFVAVTEPAPESSTETNAPVADDPATDDAPTSADLHFYPQTTAQTTAATQDADLADFIRDTNERIRRIESLVSDFVSEAKPYLERIEKGGISAFLGMMFGTKG